MTLISVVLNSTASLRGGSFFSLSVLGQIYFWVLMKPVTIGSNLIASVSITVTCLFLKGRCNHLGQLLSALLVVSSAPAGHGCCAGGHHVSKADRICACSDNGFAAAEVLPKN